MKHDCSVRILLSHPAVCKTLPFLPISFLVGKMDKILIIYIVFLIVIFIDTVKPFKYPLKFSSLVVYISTMNCVMTKIIFYAAIIQEMPSTLTYDTFK